jgi:hypothetical protein
VARVLRARDFEDDRAGRDRVDERLAPTTHTHDERQRAGVAFAGEIKRLVSS